MKTFLLLLICLGGEMQLNAQSNLVPNCSFEDTVSCPQYLADLDHAIDWGTFGGTPDYLHPCNQIGLAPPATVLGFQYPRTGIAYAAIITYQASSDWREYPACKLNQHLVVGQKYFVSYWISLADWNGVYIGTNKHGAKFTMTPFSFTNPIPTNNSATIYNDSIIVETTNWVQIKGSFIADSAYKYLVIGNFFDNAHTDTALITSVGNESWYFLDDVCVSTDSLTCEGPIECLVVHTGIDMTNSSSYYISPNPATSTLTLTTPGPGPHQIKLINNLGQIVYEASDFAEATSDQVSIDVSSLAEGIYFITVTTLTGSRKPFCAKVVLRH